LDHEDAHYVSASMDDNQIWCWIPAGENVLVLSDPFVEYMSSWFYVQVLYDGKIGYLFNARTEILGRLIRDS
jgi:hypothetical protein